ncbi:MAG: hypothetical protein KDB27_21655 [Planctomycetales bacterium]|nr:hypothetical protein [Planctomycetales bacterium]
MILIVAFILLGITALYSIKHPAIMVAAAFCVYGFEQWAQVKMPFFVVNSTFLNFYVGVLTLLGVGLVALRGHNPLNPFPNGVKLVYAMYIYAYVSILWSTNTTQSLVIGQAYAPYIASSVFLAPLLVYRDSDYKRAFMGTILMGSVIMLMLILGTRIHDWGRTIVIEHDVKVLDKAGEYTDRLSPLAVAEMGAQVGLLILLMNFKGIQRVWSLIRWPVVFAGLYLIVRSGSRGQLMAVFAVAVAFYGASKSKSKAGGAAKAIIGLALFAGLTVVVMSALDAFDRWNVEKMSSEFQETRFSMAGQLFTYWFTRPQRWIFGLGGAASWDPDIIGSYCHVQPVEVLCEFGAVGFVMYATIIIMVIMSWLNTIKIYKGDPSKRGMSVAMAALFAFSFILSLKQGAFIGTPSFGLTAILLFRFEALAIQERDKQASHQAYWRWYQYQQAVQQHAAAQQQPVFGTPYSQA